ncbi:hypothetical protein ACFXTI_042814 [Malus domestica]
MASKLCDSCQSATATLYCRTDSAFLCVNCNSKIHAASWLLPNPKAVEKSRSELGAVLVPGNGSVSGSGLRALDPKLEEAQEQNSCGADGVVLVQSRNMQPLLVNDHSFELDFSADATRFRQPLLGPNLLLPRLCNGATPPATLAEFTLDGSKPCHRQRPSTTPSLASSLTQSLCNYKTESKCDGYRSGTTDLEDCNEEQLIPNKGVRQRLKEDTSSKRFFKALRDRAEANPEALSHRCIFLRQHIIHYATSCHLHSHPLLHRHVLHPNYMAPPPSLQLRQPTCQPLRQCTSRFQIWFSGGFGSVSNPMPISSFSCPLDHLPRSPPLRNSSIEEAAAMPLQEYVDRMR